MGESNSDSNPSNLDISTSINTDDSMNDAEADALTEVSSPATFSLGGMQVRREMPEVHFPAQEFLQLMEGLNKLPSWTVYPTNLTKCLRAATLIVRGRQRVSSQDATMLRRLTREGVPMAFSKCLDDHAVNNWGENTQKDIFRACCELVELVVAKLEVLVDGQLSAEAATEVDDDLQWLLSELTTAFDPACVFHTKNADAELPDNIEPLLPSYAQAMEEPDATPISHECDATPGRQRSESPEDLRLTQHVWLAHLVNLFGARKGFDHVYAVLDKPSVVSITFLDYLLAPIVKAEDVLLAGAMEALVGRLHSLLGYLSAAIREDLEVLSDQGRDRMFTCSSNLLEKINLLLARYVGAPLADAAVGKVQRQFVMRMLGQSSFTRHLSAVRETNSLLMRALELRTKDDGNSVKVNVEWMRENDVVKQLLRANLHQKQYVDQVQKVLKNLTIEGGLQEDHLDLLWNLTEKVDTFETVKNNVYNMLGELAQDFNAEQLDVLFKKFESCAGWPVPDAMKIMDLMRRLAKSDTKGVMAQRVMGLLWSMMMNPEAPSEVAKSPAMTEALQAYADRKGLVSTEFTFEYMRQCVAQIQQGASVRAALHLLLQLIHGRSKAGWMEDKTVQELDKDYRMVEIVIASLEDNMAQQRATVAANPQHFSTPDALRYHDEVLQEYVHFLLLVPSLGALQIPWNNLERIWATLVENPVSPSDRSMAFRWFQAACLHKILSTASLHRLLAEKLTLLDVSSMSVQELDTFWPCFMLAFRTVGMEEDKLSLPPILSPDEREPLPVVKSLDLTGLQLLWRVVLDTDERSLVANDAQMHLVSLHTSLTEALQEQAIAVRTQFISTCLGELLSAAQHLTGKIAGAGSWKNHAGPAPVLGTREQLMASRRAPRCLALLQDLVTRCQGRTMPAQPQHAASFQGSPARFDVSTNSQKQPHNRFRIVCHGNLYVGQMRRQVAAKMGVRPENVRMICHGHELVNDAKLVREVNLVDGANIMATSTPNANSYTVLSSEKAAQIEAASPAMLLADSPELYDVLLCLADFCPRSDVRRNAMRLLDIMPTDRSILTQLAAALSSSDPAASMQRLLLTTTPAGVPAAKPARLQYTLQALNALLFPVALPEEDVGAVSALPASAISREMLFVSSGCIHAVLQAVKAASMPGIKDVDTLRSLYSTAQLLLSRLQTAIARQSSADSNSDSNSTDQPMLPQEVAQSSEVSISSAEPRVTVSADSAEAMSGVVQLAPKAGPIDRAILAEMMLFYLNLAVKAGRGWDGSVKPAPGQEQLLPDQDALINQEAMLGLKGLLELQPQLLDTLLRGPEYQQALWSLMLQGLLSPWHEVVRLNTLKLGERLAKSGAGAGHLHLLEMLRLEHADAQPRHCAEFYRLHIELIRTIPRNPPQVREREEQIAEQMLTDLVELTPSLHAVDEDDLRLEGKLALLLELVTVLGRWNVGTKSGGGLVHRLITEYLFPEAWFLYNMRECTSFKSFREFSEAELAAAFTARCLTKTSRTAALNLLGDLMCHSSSNLREGGELLRQIHFSYDILREGALDHLPTVHTRKQDGFVGLKNAGATCYMNSVFQQLFMQPSIRRLILNSQEVSEEERADSVFYQLQNMFANLALSNRDFYRPFGFWKAFKDYDGEPLNVREHQDAYEFFTRLQDLVDQQMRNLKERPVMQMVMGGKFAQQIICRSHAYRSEKEEDFYQISLDVRGKCGLEESLDFYVQGELMEGDNQYLCEELGKKVDAVKRNCIKVLPHMLVIHLKRFEYDYETMNRWKIKDRFEFPQELDMYKYTVMGLEEREAREAALAEGAEVPPASKPTNRQQYQYHLKGIVVHSGTAFAGHYYSYIKAREEGGQGSANAGKWFCFDDNQVEPWDLANLDRDCFGGKYTVDLSDTNPQVGVKEYDRPNSAYMLFYERSDSLEPADVMDAILAPAESSVQTAPMPAATPTVPLPHLEMQDIAAQERGPGMLNEAEATVSGRGLSTVPIPDLATTVPSIYEGIMQDNLTVIQEIRLLDKDYFRFLHRLVKESCEEPSSPPSSMRRTELSPTKSNVSAATSSGQADAEQPANPASQWRGADSERVAERIMNLALQFLFRVFLRSHSTLREDQAAWQTSLLSLMDAKPAANRWLLVLCCGDQAVLGAPEYDFSGDQCEVLHTYLLWCDLDDIRNFVAMLLLQALKNAAQHDDALPTADSWQEALKTEGTGAWAAFKVLHNLRQQLGTKDLISTKYHPHQLISIISEYASMGPAYVEHLIRANMTKPLTLAAEAADDNRCGADTRAALVPLDLLVRSTDFSMFVGERNQKLNPYHIEGSCQLQGSKAAWDALNKGHFLELLLLPGFLHQDYVTHLLQYLLWYNEAPSRLFVKSAIQFLQKQNAENILRMTPTLVELIVLEDDWRLQRVKLVLLTSEGGLVRLVNETPQGSHMQPYKRFMLIRLILLILNTCPGACHELRGEEHWSEMAQWLQRCAMVRNVAQHPDFQAMEGLLQDLIGTAQDAAAVLQLEEDDSEGENNV